MSCSYSRGLRGWDSLGIGSLPHHAHQGIREARIHRQAKRPTRGIIYSQAVSTEPQIVVVEMQGEALQWKYTVLTLNTSMAGLDIIIITRMP